MAAERIQPALSSIGVGRGGAQVLQPIDPRQEVRPNQVVEDYKKRLDAQLDARNAQRKKAQDALSEIESGTLPSFNKAIENRTQEVMSKRGEDPDVFLNEVLQLQKDAARIKAQEDLFLSNIKTGKLDDVYIKDTDGRVKPFFESEKYFSTVSGEGFDLNKDFGDEVLSMLSDPRQVLEAPPTTPEKYAANLFSEIAKNYGMTEELDRINKRVGAGEDFAEVIKTSDIPPEVYENFEKRLAEGNTFKEIYDKSIMLRENMTPAEFLVSQGTEESPNYADYVAGKASFIEEIVPSKRKVTSSVSRIPEGADRGAGDEKEFDVTIASVGEGDKDELVTALVNKNMRQVNSIADSFGEDVEEDERVEYVNKQRERLEGELRSTFGRGFEARKSELKSAKPTTTTGKELPEITIGGERGTLSEIVYDDSGKGVAILNVPVRQNFSEKGSDGRLSTTYTVYEPTAVSVSTEDIKAIENRYQINILDDNQEVKNPFE